MLKGGVVIYGGTFDPVHFGHLRSAIEVGQVLGAKKVNLIPSYLPPHRDATSTSAQQRLDMLTLATRDIECLQVDPREVKRKGFSYTVETLKEIRQETGPGESVSIVMGADAYALLHEWFAWETITDLAHLVILERPGYVGANPVDKVVDWASDKLVDETDRLSQQPAGLICRLQLTQLDISATRVREMVRTQAAIEYLLPQSVIDYICSNGLYR